MNKRQSNRITEFLESEIPIKSRIWFLLSIILCSFAYAVLGFASKFLAIDSGLHDDDPGANAFLLSFVDDYWWFFLSGSFGCLLLWHYLSNVKSIKKSLALGVSALLFSNLILLLGLFVSIIAFLYEANQ